MVNIPSSEELDSMFEEVKAVLTHPEFRQALEEASSLPAEQRARALSTRLTRDALVAKGVQIPDSMSISMDDVETSDTPDGTAMDSATASASATTGGVHMYSLSTQVCLPFLPCITVFHRRRRY